MRFVISIPAAVLVAALSACGGTDPCLEVSTQAPPEAQQLMEQGYEVSKEVSEDLECELQPSGQWERDA